MKKIILFAAFLTLLAACSKKQRYTVVGSFDDRSFNNKEVIFRNVMDASATVDDTITIKKRAFKWKGSVETAEVRIAVIPSVRVESFIVVLEEGTITVDVRGNRAFVGGTPLNDKIRERNRQNQSIVDRLNEMDQAYRERTESGTPLTPQEEETYRTERYALLVKNTDDIIAFTKENIDNVVGKFFFMKYYQGFPPERKAEMMSFATDELKAIYGKERRD